MKRTLLFSILTLFIMAGLFPVNEAAAKKTVLGSTLRQTTTTGRTPSSSTTTRQPGTNAVATTPVTIVTTTTTATTPSSTTQVIRTTPAPAATTVAVTQNETNTIDTSNFPASSSLIGIGSRSVKNAILFYRMNKNTRSPAAFANSVQALGELIYSSSGSGRVLVSKENDMARVQGTKTCLSSEMKSRVESVIFYTAAEQAYLNRILSQWDQCVRLKPGTPARTTGGR